MKKILGGIVVLVVVGVTALIGILYVAPKQELAKTEASAPIVTHLDWTGMPREFVHGWRPTPGIYIHRPEGEFGISDYFWATVAVEQDLIDLVVGDDSFFQFTAIKKINGVWQETSLLVLEQDNDGAGVTWFLRKGMPAGHYGIRMVPFVNGEQAGIYDEYMAEWTDIEVIYEILYADRLQYIRTGLLSGQGGQALGGNFVDVRNRLGQTIEIGIFANTGAMDMGRYTPQTISNGMFAGNLFIGAVISLQEGMNITVERGGFAVDGIILYSNMSDRLALHIPSNLPADRFVIRIRHQTNDTIFGEFVIDNVGSVVFNPTDLSGAVIAFFVLGTLFSLAAIFLFATPKTLVYLQQRQFAKFENKRYMTTGEGAKDDKAYKAQTAKSALEASKEKAEEDVKKTKGRGFLLAMQESRQRREIAREAGLTMEEFKELEAKQKKLSDAKEGGLASFRQAAYEQKVSITEEKVAPETKKTVDGSEFDLLDSVRTEQPRGTLIQDTPLISDQTAPVQDTPIYEPEPDTSGSILSRLKRLTDEG